MLDEFYWVSDEKIDLPPELVAIAVEINELCRPHYAPNLLTRYGSRQAWISPDRAEHEDNEGLESAPVVVPPETMDHVRKRFLDLMRGIIEPLDASIRSFGWTQYSPWFNDGEPLWFSPNLGHESILINGQPAWSYDGNGLEEQVARMISGILQHIAPPVYHLLAGDDVFITVTRNGMTVEACDHD